MQVMNGRYRSIPQLVLVINTYLGDFARTRKVKFAQKVKAPRELVEQ